RHAPVHVRPGLMALLEGLPEGHRPRLVRGDCACGSEGEMAALEALGQPYLFKLRQSAGVRKLVQRQWRRQTWCELGQGWQGCEDELRLLGWSRARRVIVMRRARTLDVLVQTRRRRGRAQGQTELVFLDANEPAKSWEYAVLVGDTAYPLASIGQLYRDRADCENGFDEIKNQWGWGGYSTQDIERCALTARAVALVYNWWSWYVRLAHPQARLEAVSSRPKLLAAVGRLTRHAGQNRILLTITHEAVAQVKRLIANVRAGLRHIEAAAPQLDKPQRWLALVRYIVARILAARHPPHPASLVFGSG
ncbi:MAG: transposase, partial [bacterium]